VADVLRTDRPRFAALVQAAAREKKLQPSLVEKDYWAVEALRAVHAGFAVEIAGQHARIQPIFKGGTSLSKAYALIHRFSEDVDLLIPVPTADPKDLSQNQRTDLMKAVAAGVSEALGIVGERAGGRKGVDLHWRYAYETTTGDPTAYGAEPSIRIELTVMGGVDPHRRALVRSLVAEYAATIPGFPTYDDLAAVEIETLAPERTLVEKLAMLHDAASNATPQEPGRLASAGRHYYDIAMLLRNEAVRARINAQLVAEIAEDADLWSSRGGFPFSKRPAAGFASSPAFNDNELMGVIRSTYSDALRWVWAERPTLEVCLDIIRKNAHIL
jgi:hypothetical protein